MTAAPLAWLRSFAGDAGVRATAVSRLIALAGAPITLYLAATRLPPNEQGWYFVAINIVAFAQLCELGLAARDDDAPQRNALFSFSKKPSS